LAIQDPIISIGRGANNTPLVSSDAKDRGEQLYYFSTAERSAFIGYQASTNKLIAAVQATVTNEVVTVNTAGSFVVGQLEGATVSVTGNVNAGNVNTGTVSLSGNVISVLNATSNITGANVNSAGLISATGNILAGGIVSATGNITGGNVLGGANVNATTHTGTTVSVTGNVTGGNIFTAGVMSSTGNVTGGNIFTAGVMSSTGNATHGNIFTGGLVSATGNITGGNIITAGLAQSASLSVTGNTATVTSANYQIGYRDLPQITTFTTLVADAGGKHYYGSGTLTIPTNATVPFTTGTAILVIASGSTTISPAGGVTLYQAGSGSTGSRTLATYGQASLVKVGTDTWYISGVGIS
jgi:hypothetical protein